MAWQILLLKRKEDVQGRLIHIQKVAEGLRKNKQVSKIEEARKYFKKGDLEAYKKIKEQLPVVCFPLTDTTRNSKNLSGFIYLDFDVKENPSLSREVVLKNLVEQYKNLVLFSRSVSGIGCFAVFYFIGLTAENYSVVHRALSREIEYLFGWKSDRNASDYKRITFISFDEEAYYDPYFEPQKVDAYLDAMQEEEKDEENYTADKDFLEKQIRALVEYCILHNRPLTPTYHEWIAAISILINTFDKAIAFELTHEISKTFPEKYDKEDTTRKFESLFRVPLKKYSIATLVWLAKKVGFKWKRNISAPPILQEYLDFLEKNSIEKVEYLVEKIWGGDMFYNITDKNYYLYQNGKWCSCPTFSPHEAIARYLQDIYNTLFSYAEQLESSQGEKIKNKIKWLYNQYNSLSAISRIASAIPSISKYCKQVHDLDSHNDKICLKNGYFCFSTMQFYEHDKSLFFTKRLNFNYDPLANCPNFLNFLNEIFCGCADKISFIQQLLGVCLTGWVDLFQGVCFFFGTGANGKSVLLKIFSKFLGEYFLALPWESVLSKYSRTKEYFIAEMYAKRMVVLSEIPANMEISESTLKDLTGGDILSGRRPFERSFNFLPTHKLIAVGNTLPRLPASDEGIWRRVFEVTFDRYFAENERRPEREILEEIEEEFPGIFNWAVHGLRNVLQQGKVQRTGAIERDSKKYREENSVLIEFLRNYYAPAEQACVAFSEFYEKYEQFCRENNIQKLYNKQKLSKIVNSTFFGGNQLYTYKGAGNISYIKGIIQIGLMPEQQQEENVVVAQEESIDYIPF